VDGDVQGLVWMIEPKAPPVMIMGPSAPNGPPDPMEIAAEVGSLESFCVGACMRRDGCSDDCLQRLHERRRHAAQFVPVGQGEAPKQLLSPRSHLDQHLASIDVATAPCRESPVDQPVYQFHRGVMPDLEPLGERTNRRPLSLGEAFDGKQELVLLRIETSCPRFSFAEGEKAPDLMPKLCQGLVVN